MESIQTILPSEIHQTIASNQITELMLKDGTILEITPNLGPLNKKKIIRRNKSSTSAQTKIQNFQENLKGNHKHYNDGNGLFGQHFKTEYSQICPDCTEVGGIIKRRQNYVLYVSKNVTEENISKKHKNKNNSQTHQQVPIQGRIPISYNYTKQTYNQQGGRVISQGFVECDYVPVSPSSFSSADGSGAGAGSSSFFGVSLFIALIMQKIHSAMIRKSITF